MKRGYLAAVVTLILATIQLAPGTLSSATGQQRLACPQQPPPGAVSVIDFGATPNGGGDDTVAFNDALDASDDVWVPSGAYEISSPLGLNDNQHLAMHCDAVLEATVQIWLGDEQGWPGLGGARAVLEVIGKTGVTIEGGTVDGQDPLAPNARAFGLFIRGAASNIHVKDTTFQRFPGGGGGDGVFIGPAVGALPVDITLENVKSLNNFRQGLSIVGGSFIDVTGGSYSGQSGGLPGTGIDIEPNEKAKLLATIPVHDVLIENAIMENNAAGGLWIHGPAGEPARVTDVSITNNTFRNNLLEREEPFLRLADAIWTKALGPIEIASNDIEVRRGDGGVVLGLDAGDTNIDNNSFIGMDDAQWAITREVEPGEPPMGIYCVWGNLFSGVWDQGHVEPGKGFTTGPC